MDTVNELLVVDAETLGTFRPFANLTPEERLQIAALCRRETYRAGDAMFGEGDEATTFYLLQSGKVVLEKEIRLSTSGTPRRATVEIMRPGDAFGLSTLIPPHQYRLSAFCLDDVEVICIDGADLRALVAENPRIGWELARWIAMTTTERLREATKRLTYFLSIVSHELRAPLAAVESYLQVLMGGFTGPLTEKQNEMLQRCSIRIKELLGLINDLLDASRLEPEHIQEEFETMDLAAVIQAALDDVRPAAQEKKIELRVEVPSELPVLTGAPGRVRQVLDNLLSNAVKFTPEGGQVTLRVVEQDDHLEISVTDTGIGIPEDDQPFIFDDFYRARNAPSGGTGLGLAIAKRIVEAHGGRIWVESPYAEGVSGSRFTFTLPYETRNAERGMMNVLPA
jgi:signal transduction histidine kinase